MSGYNEGRVWPADGDKKTKTSNYHVPSSSLRSDTYDPLKRRIVITETAEEVQDRLKEDFPLYRAAQFIRRVIGTEKRKV